jgi:putative ABC transport system permease protein
MGNFLRDLRYGARVLLKSPGFTLVAVLALALGIGANSAIFSVVNAVLLRPLPYSEPDRLVRVGGTSKTELIGTFSPPDFFDWRARNTVFEGMAAYDASSPSLTGGGEPERLNAARVSPGFFSLLRTPPALGREFLPQEEQRGQHRVAVLSHALWQRRFGGDPLVVGRKIELSGEGFEVVGVMPADFEPPQFAGLDAEPPSIWVPFAPDLSQWGRDGRSVDACIARLKPTATVEQARSEMEAIALGLQEQYPKTNSRAGVRLDSLREQLVGGARRALLVFIAAVGFVLLIACANVANMLLARAATRRKEIAIRTALGASRARVARQLLTESVLLAMAGGGLGLLLALWANEFLLALSAGALPRVEHVALDWRVVFFTLLVSVATGLVFGLAPALSASKTDLTESLKEGGRAGAAGLRSRARSALVVSEVALSLVLLVAAGLLVKSFWRLQQVSPGFDPDGVLTMNVFLPGLRYPEEAQHAVFFERVLERVKALPGVRHAGATSNLPVSGNYDRLPIYVEGQPPPAGGEAAEAERYMVSDDYFRALGVPVLAGRGFGADDSPGKQPVVVVGEAVARASWPAGDAVGRRIKLGDTENPWLTVVGVAGDVRHYGPDTPANFQVYLPHRQSPSQAMTLVVRSAGDPEALAAAVRGAVWSVDKDQPVYDVKTMRQLLSASTAARRFNMLLIGVFASVALALAVVGIYGVMSYTVEQRTREIGVRVALGAGARDIYRLIVGRGMATAGLGVGVGLAASFAATRAMKSLLFGVEASDPVIFASVALLLSAVALLACYLPARRAARVDPAVALRYE